MKKTIINFILAAIIMCSCGVDRSDIEKACNQGDFEEAYRLAEKTDWYGAESFVAERECLYVLENMGEEGLAKVAIITTEHHVDQDDLLKFALSLKDESAAIKLNKMKGGDTPTECVEYAVAEDLKDFVLAAIEVSPALIDNNIIANYLKGKGIYDEAAIRSLQKTYEELLTKKLEGKRLPLGVQSAGWHHVLLKQIDEVLFDNYPMVTAEHISYYNALQDYNSKCLQLLEQAIALKKLELANKTILLIKQNYKITEGKTLNAQTLQEKAIKIHGEEVYKYQCYIELVDDDLNHAKQLLERAIKAGAFN